MAIYILISQEWVFIPGLTGFQKTIMRKTVFKLQRLSFGSNTSDWFCIDASSGYFHASWKTFASFPCWFPEYIRHLDTLTWRWKETPYQWRAVEDFNHTTTFPSSMCCFRHGASSESFSRELVRHLQGPGQKLGFYCSEKLIIFVCRNKLQISNL